MEKEMIDELVKWIIRCALIVIGSVSMWIAKTVYSHEIKFNVIETKLVSIASDISEIKQAVLNRKK